ncbi:MAG: hypothetical protein LBQ95_08665 [Lachnospiraceae bacterium]|jgi:hypothetical protein|nr:hypothetical protein [Lachnospiraceae bacterium]
MAVLNRTKKGDYLSVGTITDSPTYAYMGLSFTEVGDSPSAVTGEKKYVGMVSASKSIKGYNWSAAFSCDQVPDADAVEDIRSIGENEVTGSDAERYYVKVDLSATAAAGAYPAKRRKVAVEVSDFPNDDGDLQISGNLLGVTDWENGTFNTTTLAWSAAAEG